MLSLEKNITIPIYISVVNICEIIFQEDFLDLTVAVKNVSGLEDALWNMYVEEEIFDCDNLYHCGSCDQLVKAAKVTTPPIS